MKTNLLPVRFASPALALAALFLSGCETVRKPKTPNAIPASFTPAPATSAAALDQSLLQRPNLEYRLGPGDVLVVEIVGDLTTRARTVVGPDGKIYFNVLPGIDVWGMTVAQARDRLVQEMQKFVREAQPISVTLLSAESQRIWVLGRLNKPGVYRLSGPTTLLEAISEAGGPSPAATFATMSGGMGMGMAASARNGTDEAADLGRAFVIRQGRMLPVDFHRLLREGDMSQNIYLQPDDFVYLPSGRVGNVHVLGAVTNPRAVDYQNQFDARAIGRAGRRHLARRLSVARRHRARLPQPAEGRRRRFQRHRERSVARRAARAAGYRLCAALALSRAEPLRRPDPRHLCADDRCERRRPRRQRPRHSDRRERAARPAINHTDTGLPETSPMKIGALLRSF
jgi:polysaccharide biosynthesis/export protein